MSMTGDGGILFGLDVSDEGREGLGLGVDMPDFGFGRVSSTTSLAAAARLFLAEEVFGDGVCDTGEYGDSGGERGEGWDSKGD